MAANDGQRLAVFGLTMREHHTLKMQQILREYKIDLPSMPSNRAALYLALFNLTKELDEKESRGIENWLTKGGPFPTPARNDVLEPVLEPITSRRDRRSSRYVEDEDDNSEDSDEVMGSTGLDDNGEEWQEYDEEAFTQAPIVISDSEDEGGNVSHAVHQTEGTTRNNSNGSEISIRREKISESESESDSSEEEIEEVITRGSPRYPARGGYRGGYRGRYRRGPVHRHQDMEVDNQNDTTVDGRDACSSTPTQEKEIECAICAESLPIASFSPKNITSTCDHDQSVHHEERACFSCVAESIASTLSEGALHRLNCVFCPELFSKSEIKIYGSAESYARYEYLLLLANPSITMCLNPHCSSGQVHTDPDNPKMICKECSFAICALHKIPWHGGQSCLEFDQSSTAIERLEQAEATAKLLASDESMICPNCEEGITRTEGCDHLMCRCGHEWCFLCRASWENIMRIGDSAHASFCPNNPSHQGSGRLLSRNPITANNPRTAELTNLIHGGAISPALAQARTELNHRRNAQIRVEAREAAEKRLRAMEANKTEERKNEEAVRKRRKVKLAPAWEEGGIRKH